MNSRLRRVLWPHLSRRYLWIVAYRSAQSFAPASPGRIFRHVPRIPDTLKIVLRTGNNNPPANCVRSKTEKVARSVWVCSVILTPSLTWSRVLSYGHMVVLADRRSVISIMVLPKMERVASWASLAGFAKTPCISDCLQENKKPHVLIVTTVSKCKKNVSFPYLSSIWAGDFV